jgi:hypothetical protein
MALKRIRSRPGFKNVDTAWKQLQNTFISFNLSRRLTKRQSSRFKQLAELVKEQTKGLSKAAMKKQTKGLAKAAVKHYYFLHNIFVISRDYHKLCTIAFSQAQIESTKVKVLNELIAKIKEQDDVQAINDLFRSLPLDSQVDEAVPRVEIMSAEREGTRQVFREYLVDKIKTVAMNDQWRAVSVLLPFYPPDLLETSVMSLEIREECVKELAMALYVVEVDWVIDSYRVVHANKTVQIIPYGFEWIAVSDENICAVFRSYIHGVINACRLRELAKGENRTDCVKIIFRNGQGTINLKMSLIDIPRIQRILSATTA